VVVPRSRFSPVKTTSDLLALRSDAYRVTEDSRLVLESARQGQPPVVELDSKYYKVMADFDRYFAGAVPSLIQCKSFKATGPMRFSPGVICQGNVEFANASTEAKAVAAGTYRDTRVNV
jgi:hypothetical protein